MWRCLKSDVEMKNEIICERHGKSNPTYVCEHILLSLQDNQTRGFHWHKDDDDELQAFCEWCWNADDDEWKASGSGNCKLLCLECFKQVALLNGETI